MCSKNGSIPIHVISGDVVIQIYIYQKVTAIFTLKIYILFFIVGLHHIYILQYTIPLQSEKSGSQCPRDVHVILTLYTFLENQNPPVHL